MNACCKYGLFTCGYINQYEAVMCYAGCLDNGDCLSQSPLFEAVVYMTWICSDTNVFTVDNVRTIITEAFTK